MKAFVKQWDETQGFNKLGSDATRVISYHDGATMTSFWGKIAREAASGMSRVEVYWDDDKVYGKPDVVGYVEDGHILSYSERMRFEASLPVEQLVIPFR